MWVLKEEANLCLSQVKAVGIEYGQITDFSTNERTRGWWGRCHKESGSTFKIEICARLLCSDIPVHSLRTVLVHEILHTVPGCFNHGKKWHDLGQRMDTAYHYNITRTASAEKLGIDDPSKKYPVPEKIPENLRVHFSPGMFVMHSIYGSGIVVALKPIGSDALVEIAFMDGTSRQFMEKLASASVVVV